jgi:hypothetical protein
MATTAAAEAVATSPGSYFNPLRGGCADDDATTGARRGEHIRAKILTQNRIEQKHTQETDL